MDEIEIRLEAGNTSAGREGAAAPEGGEVVRHNDVAHYNTVFRADTRSP